MTIRKANAKTKTSTTQLISIKKAIIRTATELLNAEDEATALSHYMDNATVVSNGYLFPSFESVAAEIQKFYDSLREINLAVWDDIRVDVLSSEVAIFTATFRWSSTDSDGVRMDLEGVWSAVFVRDKHRWKIRFRHESFR